jgi:hypothetical protein
MLAATVFIGSAIITFFYRCGVYMIVEFLLVIFFLSFFFFSFLLEQIYDYPLYFLFYFLFYYKKIICFQFSFLI